MSTKQSAARTALKRALFTGVSLVAAASAAPTFAQTSAASRGGYQVQDLIVTARKREESIMRTPVIMQAVAAEQIQQLHITDVRAIDSVVPGLLLNYAISNAGAVVFLRGIGVAGAGGNVLDQSVALNIDGFTSATGAFYRQSVFDAAQIEVLKGPQSLFFGKSTSAGVIAVHSADPTPTWDVALTGSYEFVGDQKDISGHVSGPLSDMLGVRAAAFYTNTNGWLRNPNPTVAQNRLPHERVMGGRLTFVFDDHDRLRAKLKTSFSRSNANFHSSATGQGVCDGPPNPNAFQIYDNCKADKYLYGFPDSKPYSATADFTRGTGSGFLTNTPVDVFRDGRPYSFTRAYLGILDVSYKLKPGLTLSSVTAQSYAFSGDAGRTVAATGPSDLSDILQLRELSEEARITSDYEGWLNFMVGGLYNRSTKGDRQILSFDQTNTTATLRRVFYDNSVTTKSEAIGGFGQLLLTPVQSWELSVGARYSRVRKRFTSLWAHNNAPGVTQGESIQKIPSNLLHYKEHKVTPEVTLTYRPDPDITAFVGYKRGYKGPGWNSFLSVQPEFTPATIAAKPPVPGEKAEGFEGGVKARVVDRQVALTLTAYRYNYKDLQVTFNDPVLRAAVIANGADARIQGVEFSADVYPRMMPGLNLSAFLNYNDTHYTSFVNAPCYVAQTLAQGCTLNSANARVQTLTGHRLFLAPMWTGKLGGGYEWDIGERYSASVDGEARYTSSYWSAGEMNPFGKQKAYTVVNAAIRLMRRDKLWELSLACRNCTNEIYITNGSDGGTTPASATVFVGRTREVLMTLTVRPQI